MGALALVADGEAAVAEEPGDRPFDLPAVSAEPFALDSMPGRAIRGIRLRSRSQARWSAEKYALSARSLPGRRRVARGNVTDGVLT